MKIKNDLDKKVREELFRLTLSRGAVFLNKFAEIDHPKFFVVAGLSQDKIYTCSFYINSNIHPALTKKQELLNLQVPIKGDKYSFLTHTSFVCCSTVLPVKTTNIHSWIINNTCSYKGQLDKDDLANVTSAIINSGLLTDEEIELYFNEE